MLQVASGIEQPKMPIPRVKLNDGHLVPGKSARPSIGLIALLTPIAPLRSRRVRYRDRLVQSDWSERRQLGARRRRQARAQSRLQPRRRGRSVSLDPAARVDPSATRADVGVVKGTITPRVPASRSRRAAVSRPAKASLSPAKCFPFPFPPLVCLCSPSVSQADKGVKDFPATIKRELDDLSLSYLDLFLLHTPTVFDQPGYPSLPEAWKTLEGFKEQGLVKSIGVSNFRVKDLEQFVPSAKIKPAVNQYVHLFPRAWSLPLNFVLDRIELHPYVWKEAEAVVEYGNKHGIITEVRLPLLTLPFLTETPFSRPTVP